MKILKKILIKNMQLAFKWKKEYKKIFCLLVKRLFKNILKTKFKFKLFLKFNLLLINFFWWGENFIIFMIPSRIDINKGV